MQRTHGDKAAELEAKDYAAEMMMKYPHVTHEDIGIVIRLAYLDGKSAGIAQAQAILGGNHA